MAKTKFKITSPNGDIHNVSVLSKWLKEYNLSEHGFRKVLRGLQETCYGGWKIEKCEEVVEVAKPFTNTSSMLNLAKANSANVTLVDIIRKENCYKVQFVNNKGDNLTRKININKVSNLKGERCSLTGMNILLGELKGSCKGLQGEDYHFSIAELKKLGYSFDIDFSAPKVVGEVVKVGEEKFSPELLESKLQDQMEAIIKEINKTQNKLKKLKHAKEELGSNLSNIVKANEFIGKMDKLLGECSENI